MSLWQRLKFFQICLPLSVSKFVMDVICWLPKQLTLCTLRGSLKLHSIYKKMLAVVRYIYICENKIKISYHRKMHSFQTQYLYCRHQDTEETKLNNGLRIIGFVYKKNRKSPEPCSSILKHSGKIQLSIL